MTKHKLKWLDVQLAADHPLMTLCLTEDAFAATLKKMRAYPKPWMPTDRADACVHVFDTNNGPAVVVCMDGWKDMDVASVFAMLVHEATHVWQEYADSIGEENPGREQEAYAIQGISQALFIEFIKQSGLKMTY
jgi:hypothetical protein